MDIGDLLMRSRPHPLTGPAWNPDAAPSTPWALLADWIAAAVADEVPGVNAVQLATASTTGVPSVRTVLLLGLSDTGARFGTSAVSPAGRDLAANPRAALVLYLREHARQIRLSGPVESGTAEESAAMFRRRSARARATTLAGEQSAPLPADAEARIRAAAERLDSDPELVDPRLTPYLLRPVAVEFWQSRPEVGEQRLAYSLTGSGTWLTERLWP